MRKTGSARSMSASSAFDDDEELPALRRKMRLASRNLTSVPKIAVSTDSLMLLDLSNNNITILPNDITLESEATIQSVFLHKNKLVSIPAEICRCQVLLDLRVSHNQLPALPPAIGKIRTLVRLDASGNRISHTPPTLSQLQNLRVLNLSENRLMELQDEDILPLTNLTELSVSNNKLPEIPLAVAALVKLRYLRLSHNRITAIDSDILRLPKLLELHLADNLIAQLPSSGWEKAIQLDTLDLSGNRLTKVPPGMGLLTNLTVLGLTRNDHLPKDLAEAALLGVGAALKYLAPLANAPQKAAASGARVGRYAVAAPSARLEEEEEGHSLARLDAIRLKRKEDRRRKLMESATNNNNGVGDFYKTLLEATLEAGDDLADVEEAKAMLVHRMINEFKIV
ncbi:hypothetical protein T484DRAFT_1955287 [Baffinella frigidus]|nr:hypothetical protein T484DRAFT_1955287 [Cryptophyta sp. CCMP2293]|mmetsp:Transcript_18653/g.44920  ORF Transcript_18653/g.44920 Transcript_18653/m.44920 type:complete len:397 (+) Transcript_18653:66-1256(+)